MATYFVRIRILKSSFTGTSNGAMTFSIASTACSDWQSGMCERRRLVVARDPFGIKLIYWRVDGGRLFFGSEMRAVRAAMPDKAEIDPTSLNLFLRNRFTPSPYTILKGVHKLAPGTKLTVQDGSYEVSRWYRFKPVPFAPAKSPDEAREELLELYKRAIKRQLISDVPVGLLLSGGLDSGLLLALMNLNGNSWPTYTVGYGSSYADDELTDAAETARILGANHSAITISQSIFEEALPKIVAALEEPIATSSIVPMYFVCQRARQDVKVALVGQGPDELFGGYKRHLGVRYGGLWAQLPSWMRGPISLDSRGFAPKRNAKAGSAVAGHNRSHAEISECTVPSPWTSSRRSFSGRCTRAQCRGQHTGMLGRPYRAHDGNR